MCGITGLMYFGNGQVDLTGAAKIMQEKIRHRGPDDEGYLVWNGNDTPVTLSGNDTPVNVSESGLHWSPLLHVDQYKQNARLVFSHRRLSIIDLSAAGHQPMSYNNGELWITYNGELYNYREIRYELEQKGIVFRTQSDTEVILAAYKFWGEKCLNRFNGMWAFVIWDRLNNKLFCSRDRFGVKPFYYYSDGSLFAFASELKALKACPLIKTSLNHEAVADYFVAGEIEYKPAGFFSNLIELFPGHSLTLNISSGKYEVTEWYQLKYNESDTDFSDSTFQQATELIREKLIDAIRLRLRSDVTVGSCLSGGIDSSAIAGIIASLVKNDREINVGERLKLFTASFEGNAIDESKWAKMVVDRTNASWYRTEPRPEELITDLEDLIYSQDIPIWSSSTYAQHRVMKLAQEQNVRVLLDGQGGDELFGGYMPYFIPFWKELKKYGHGNRRLQEMNAWGENVKQHNRKETLKQYILPSLPITVQLFLQKRYFPELAYLDNSLFEHYKSGYSTHESSPSLNGALHSEFVNTRLKGYLKCEDRCSMWHSVESRTPFADDHVLIETVFNTPGLLKIKNGTTKYLLREAVAPFIPDEIRQRRDKMGYVTPHNDWIAQLRPQLKHYLDQDFSGIIRKDKLLNDYDSFFDQRGKPENGRMFKFIAFAVWKKVYNM